VWQRLSLSGPVYCLHRGRFATFVVGGYGGDRRPQRGKALGGYWGKLGAMLDMDFRESPLGELLRIPLPRTSVNRAAKRVRAAPDPRGRYPGLCRGSCPRGRRRDGLRRVNRVALESRRRRGCRVCAAATEWDQINGTSFGVFRPFVMDRNIRHFFWYGALSGRRFIGRLGWSPPSPHPRAFSLSCPSLAIYEPGRTFAC